jgi:hypothetical protein
MNDRGTTIMVRPGWLRGTVFFSVLTALLFCLAVTAPPMVGSLHAAGSLEDAAASARKLQLEGTRLQLQGDLQGAVKNYRESIALLPNQRLETLIEQLEKQIEKTRELEADAPAVAVLESGADPGTDPAAATGPVAPAAVTVAEEQPGEAVQGAVGRERITMHPEEDLVYAFIDWVLAQVPDAAQETGFRLLTDRDYALNAVDGYFEVRFDPCTLYIMDDSGLDLGPLVFHLEPRSPDILAVRLFLPETVPIIDDTATIATLTVGHQEISGEWDRRLLTFDRADLNLGNLTIADSDHQGRLDIRELVLATILAKDEQGAWEERYQGQLSGLSFVEESVSFNINHIDLLYNLGGIDFPRYLELRKNFTAIAGRAEDLPLAEWKDYFGAIDEFIQIVNAYANAMTIQGVSIRVDDMVIGLDTLEALGNMHRNEESGSLVYDSRGVIKGLDVSGQETAENADSPAVTVEQVTFAGKGTMKKMPPDLFSELFQVFELAEQEVTDEVESEMAGHAMGFVKTFLGLIESSSFEINLSGLKALNVMPEPVTLDIAEIGGGFDVGIGEGGLIRTYAAFAGLGGLDQGSNTIPVAGRYNFELGNIPSLLGLLPSPGTLTSGDMAQIQGQLMANSMGILMASSLAFSLTDSFIAFPASRFDINLLANLDSAASLFSTGTLNIVIENSEEFTRIIQDFGADPEMLQMLTTLVALADRSEVNGTLVDRIDARIDQEGKVFINSKDVTLMFFPE